MKLSTKDTNSNYLAKVVRIENLKPIEGADRIQLATVDYMDTVVSKDLKKGTICVYFVANSRIHPDVLHKNNLYRKSDLNKDKDQSGFFNEKGVVKPIKLLKGTIKSEIFILPAEKIDSRVDWENYIGETFDTVDGVLIVEKYFIPKRESRTSNSGRKVRASQLIEGQVNLHVSTAQLRRNLNKIYPYDTISVTEKIHGSSITAQNVLVKRKLSWVDKIAKFFGAKVKETEYKLIYTSRKVVKNDDFDDVKNNNHFYGNDIWGTIVKQYDLENVIPKGYAIYGEIAGHVPGTTSFIQEPYDYSCQEGEAKLYIYRMTRVNPEGLVTELSTAQIREFCQKSDNLEHVPVHFIGLAKDMYNIPVDENWHKNFIEKLERDYTEMDCPFCLNDVPREGIVIRNEKLWDFEAYKLKSFRFLGLESDQLDAGQENIEDNG